MNLRIFLITTSLFCISFFVRAQNPVFNYVKQCGGAGMDEGSSVALDPLGNVYTIGNFSGTVDFNPGAGTYNLTSAGGADVFIMKMNASGTFLWAVQFSGSGNDYGESIAFDALGNVYTTGSFESTVDFNPGAGTSNLSSAGGSDVFICKLDETGAFIWAKRMGSSNADQGNEIFIDGNGNILTTGYFSLTVDFNPSTNIFNLTSGGLFDAFVCKLDENGAFLWAKQFSGASSDAGCSIFVDAIANIYVTGYFFETADFNPGASIYNLTAEGQTDIFISKLNENGNFIWAKKIGGSDWDSGLSFARGPAGTGSIYTTGYFQGSVDFDPGPSTYNLVASGVNQDVYVSKLDTGGNFIWAKKMGGSDSDIGRSLSVDGSGDIYITGDFWGTADFNPGAGTYYLSSSGVADIFVSKLDASGNFLWARKMGGTGHDYGLSIIVNASEHIYTTGGFWNTVDFDPGAGTSNLTSAGDYDIFVHKMIPCTNTSSTISVSACDTYTAPDGAVYTTSGTKTAIIPNHNICDSTITINLTIKHSTASSISPTACDSYTAPDGTVYTTSGVKTSVISNHAGCDSTITINLTINTVDASTTISDPSITADAIADTYQWLDCDNAYAPIGGATLQSYIATANGNYAVIVTQGLCSDTSACVPIVTVGIDSENLLGIALSPNPSNGRFTLELNEAAMVEIYNALGSLIYNASFEKGKHALSLNLADGVYLLKASNAKGSVKYRMVIWR